jgi:hypothetical protein
MSKKNRFVTFRIHYLFKTEQAMMTFLEIDDDPDSKIVI